MRIFFVFFILLSTACSTLTENRGRELRVDKIWARSVQIDDDLGPRAFHGFSPIVTDTYIFQGNGRDAISAVYRKNGREVWSRKIENGVGSGAEIRDGVLYFGGSDGQFYALESESGKTIWSFPVRAEVLAPPLVTSDMVFILGVNNVVYAIDRKSGKQKWLYNRVDTTTFSIRGGGQPVLHNGQLFIGFSDGFFVSLNASTGNLNWERSLSRSTRFRDVNASAVVDGNALYVASYEDSLYKLSANDGQIIWRLEKGSHTALTIKGKVGYYSTTNGEILAIDTESGKELWTYKLKTGIGTQPKVLNELLVVGDSNSDLIILNRADGQKVGQFQPGRGLQAAPTVIENSGEIFFISNDGNLFAIKVYWALRGERLPWEKF